MQTEISGSSTEPKTRSRHSLFWSLRWSLCNNSGSPHPCHYPPPKYWQPLVEHWSGCRDCVGMAKDRWSILNTSQVPMWLCNAWPSSSGITNHHSQYWPEKSAQIMGAVMASCHSDPHLLVTSPSGHSALATRMTTPGYYGLQAVTMGLRDPSF